MSITVRDTKSPYGTAFNDNRHEFAHARYMAVKHLSVKDASHVLRCSPSTVREFRRRFPDTAPVAPPLPIVREKPRRPGIIQHVIPMAEPSRSASAGSVPVMLVSLPAPPWDGGFERHGVRA